MLESGKKPTIQAIRAALGNRGSVTTIQQYKKKLDEEDLAAKDSPLALESFRTLWALAIQEGKAQRDEEFLDFKETIEALSSDSKRFEGEAIASRLEAEEATQKLEDNMTRLNWLNDEITRIRDGAERNAAKLVEVTERYHEQTEALRENLTSLQDAAHELELKLARAEAKLEVADRRNHPPP